ncbi:MAG TPA: hypothetical protein VNN17_00795 [Terriglobia bacterium]|nr:hypothetical protein [Terriglobia bacterium]
MELAALDAYLSACASLGMFSTSILVESRRDIDTPARLLLAYQEDWIPQWVLGAAASFDHVLVGTYWNYEAFLPSGLDSSKWQRLLYLTSRHLLSEQIRFPRPVLKALETSVESSLQKNLQAGIEITDPEGTRLSIPRFAVEGSGLTKLDQANGQIVVSIYYGLNPPMHLHLQGGEIKEISGGGKLGDAFRRVASQHRLTLQEISFGLNPKAALPEDFTSLDWAAWVSAWSTMNERSGTVRYRISATAQKGFSWQLANYYPTVRLGNEPLIQDGHLLALDSPQVAATLPEREKQAAWLKELWPPYPKVAPPTKTGGS